MVKYELNQKTRFTKIVTILRYKPFGYIFIKFFYKYIYPVMQRLGMTQKTFLFQNKRYVYYIHPYNITWANERAVELPILFDQIKPYKVSQILEVGNVLGHYIKPSWTVVDKYERSSGVINCDAEEFCPNYKFKLIFSISTIEHVGFDEEPKDEQKAYRVLNHLRTLLLPGGRLFITVPIGWNTGLDKQIKYRQICFDQQYHFIRIPGLMNVWKEISTVEAFGRGIGKNDICANELFLGIIFA